MNVRLRNFAIKSLPSILIKAIIGSIEKNSKLQAFKEEYKVSKMFQLLMRDITIKNGLIRLI